MKRVLALAFGLVLTACGGDGSSETPNRPPIAVVPVTYSVVTGSTVTLDGSASWDADGDALTYSWTMTGRPVGSAAVLAGAATVKPTFVADVDGYYGFRLVVNDGSVDSDVATMSIVALPPP